jgi:uncharacterized protein (TIGR03435 family)
MRITLPQFLVASCLALTAAMAPAQTAPTFEVASIRPAAELDMAKVAAGIQAGQMPKIGAHIDAAKAEYTYVALKELIALAYKVKPYQITGPDWLASQRFDIVAKLPEGASKDDVPKMLQALLEERFKLTVHRDSKEHPVLALVVGKGGPKMKESLEAPEPLDENAPLKPGEMKLESAEGPVRLTVGKDGSATMNMGSKGAISYKMDPATQSLHMEASKVTMAGFADMLTQFFSQTSGGGGRQVVDMTGLKGNYQVALDFAMADLISMARQAGVGVPMPAGGAAPAALPADAASDPSGASSLLAAVQALGLKLEQRKAVVEQLVIDHVEKTPTEN